MLNATPTGWYYEQYRRRNSNIWITTNVRFTICMSTKGYMELQELILNKLHGSSYWRTIITCYTKQPSVPRYTTEQCFTKHGRWDYLNSVVLLKHLKRNYASSLNVKFDKKLVWTSKDTSCHVRGISKFIPDKLIVR